MTDEQIESRLKALALDERKITVEILLLIIESEKRQIPLDAGYPSTFEWLVREIGYSHSAAYRRMQSARLLAEVPGIKIKLIEGNLNISSVSKTQAAIYKTEKLKKTKIPLEKKVEVLGKIENASPLEIDKELSIAFPEVVKRRKEKASHTGNGRMQLVLDLSEENYGHLKRVRSVRSHIMLKQTWGDLVGYIALDYLKRNDPMIWKPKRKRRRSNA